MSNSITGRTGAGSGGVEAQGILDSRFLPDKSFADQWSSIVVEKEQKDRLLSQAILNFTLRPKINRADLPLHGIILLVGAPGTGKTSLARGLASQTAQLLASMGKFLYLEVEPHSLTSSALGKSQRAVTELLSVTVAENAQQHPLIVLLDEVETLAVDRSKLSLDANPVDVHRATDAVLAQLDQLADRYPQLLFIGTSNFAEAIDQAFFSRADLVETMNVPGRDARRQILVSTLNAFAVPFPQVKQLSTHREIDKVADVCEGLDGRRIRKLVAAACTFHKETALDPNLLTINDLLCAAEHAQREARAASKGGAN